MLNEIREDLRVECSKFGQIRKLLLFDVSSWLGQMIPKAPFFHFSKLLTNVSMASTVRFMFLYSRSVIW